MLTLTYQESTVPRGSAVAIRERVAKDWCRFKKLLRKRWPGFADSFWCRAVELGELRDRPHIHLVLDRPLGMTYADLLGLLEGIWGPSRQAWLAQGSPTSFPGLGFFDLEDEDAARGGLTAYLLGDVSTWAKKGIGYMSKSPKLCQAIALQKALFALQNGREPSAVGEWEHLADVDGVSYNQRRVTKALRASGRAGDVKGVVDSCLNLDNLAWHHRDTLGLSSS